MGNRVKNNPLITRADVERAAIELIEPLLPLLSEGKARLNLGDTGAVYPPDIAEMEAKMVDASTSAYDMAQAMMTPMEKLKSSLNVLATTSSVTST